MDTTGETSQRQAREAGLPPAMDADPSPDAVVVLDENLILQLLDAEASAELRAVYRQLQMRFEASLRVEA